MRILLLGANGFIGGRILAALRGRHEVIACGRRPAAGAAGFIPADLARDQRAEDWLPRLRGIDAVINAAGIIQEQGRNRFDALHRAAPCALFAACVQAGLRRAVQISALGADQPQPPTEFLRSKRAADQFLAGLELDWIILYPSLVYGAGGKSFELFSALAAQPIVPLPYGGTPLLQPVHVDDLAQGVANLLEAPPQRLALPVVGAQALSLRDWLELLRQRITGQPEKLPGVSLPNVLMQLTASLGGMFSGGLISRASLRLLRQGSVADAEPFRRASGIQPRSPRQGLAEMPLSGAERREARSFFVYPLLLLSLALVWISTGLVSAFFYPVEDSYALLARLGISDFAAPLALYGAAALDIALGVGLFFSRHIRLVGILQILLILGYTGLITLFLPEFWLHPYGPLTKNLPLLAATLVLIARAE
jgi:uncharacterized protein YbjT (DUF2867 family)